MRRSQYWLARTVAQVVNTEILINTVLPQETRVAIVENGALQEIHIECAQAKGLVGNIYKGKITRVLPGMQAAFVDIGLARAGFIHVSDIMPLNENGMVTEQTEIDANIRKWVHEGQEVLVQVLKDPLGSKGARLNMHLSIASRYLVYMPDLDHVGVSLRLEDPAERERLQQLVTGILSTDNAQGYIVRTVAEGVDEAALRRDIDFLAKLWERVHAQQQQVKAPGIVYEDLCLLKWTLRDLLTSSIEAVRIDSQIAYDTVYEFAETFLPQELNKLQLYVGEDPIFEAYGIEAVLSGALERRVPLKSGGYLVIDETEAMTTIDVNTGAFVGSTNLEETIFKTNLEAVQAITRQLRLRNLGGIIVLDFIDMVDVAHQQRLIDALDKALANDPARTYRTALSDLGLVEMTRKRNHESLRQQMCKPCQHCEGRGYIKSTQAMAYEIFRDILREARAYTAAGGLLVFAAEMVVAALLDEHAAELAELEAQVECPVTVKVEPSFHQEIYEIALV